MRRITTAVLVIVLLFTIGDRVVAQTGRDLFQQALVKERANGDLRGAIAIYERIVREFTTERALTANALVQLGECYEKLGSTEAERAYQRVVSEFAEQTDFVVQARARLAALRSATAGGRGPVARRLFSTEGPDAFSPTMTASPDGRQVAYVKSGRLFVRDLASDVEEPLLSEQSAVLNVWPVWSPDGTRIAFSQRSAEPQAWLIRVVDIGTRKVVSVSGSDVPLAGAAASPVPVAWSQDGGLLLYRENFGHIGPLGTIPVAGGSRTVLADSVQSGGSFSPDGRYVTYAAGTPGSEQVFVQPVGGGARRQITSAPGGNRSPVWSPDGSAIAYFRIDGIWIVPVAGGAPRLAYANQTASSFRGGVWTAAGGLYLTEIQIGVPYRIEIQPATGAVAGTVEKLPVYPMQVTGSFVWSPDMRYAAFPTLDRGLVIYGVDGTSITSRLFVADRMLYVFSWSADGREVFFRSTENNVPPSGSVMALDVASGAVRTLAAWTREHWVRSVSANGRRIVFWDPEGLTITDAAQSGSRLVAPSVDADSEQVRGNIAEISPLGDQIAFARGARKGSAGSQSLWAVRSDGSGLHAIAHARDIGSVLWDPSRMLAYSERVDSATVVLKIVEVATGAERGTARLPSDWWGNFELSDWSHDGRYVGMIHVEPRTEYWVVQGLEGEVR